MLAFGNGEVTINTPIPTRRCEDIARALHSRTTCRRGALSVDAPLYTSWVHAAFTTALDGSGSYVTQGVDISERATAPGLDVTFVVRPGSSPVAWCLATPLTPNTLTISRGGTERYTQSFSGDDGVDCHAGVRLVVASHGIASVPPVVLQGTDSLDMKAVSRSAEVRGMTAQYKLDPGGRHGVDRTSDVRFVGPVETDLLIQGSRASLQMKSGSVSSAVTDNDEAVPSLWTSHQWWLAPLFITILTALVVAPLLAVVDSAVKWLKSKH